MKRMLLWFFLGVVFSLSVMMIVFGIMFIRDVYLHQDEAVFGSFIFGVILLLVGGGLLCSTVAETVQRVFQKKL